MGSAERRERERLEVRTAILDATRAILSERGYEGLTMRGVADRIEYSAAALYKHFTDREHLVRELCAQDFYAFNEMLRARQAAKAQDKKDPHAALRAIAEGYCEFALRYPEQYRVMFMTQLPRTVGEADAPPEDAYKTVVRAVEAAQAQGSFPGLLPDLVAQTLWAAVHGVVSLEIVNMCGPEKKIPFVDVADRIHTMVEVALAGAEALAARGRKSRRR